MSTLGPVVGYRPGTVDLHSPGLPAACRGRIWERSRLEWHARDGGDPLQLLSDFAASHGVPLDDISGSPSVIDSSTCGIAVLLSPPSVIPSPAPAVPDFVAVAFEHGREHRPARVSGPPSTVGNWTPSWRPSEHAAAVEEVRSAISRGDVYVVNLVGHTSAPFAGDPAPALARVAALPGARYGGVLRGETWWLATASPETLVEVSGGRVVTRPIKGTRPATAAGRADLLGSAKERAEHVMIVDLERNDLARVAAVGSVQVEELFAIRRWSGLWQAESTVSARLAPGVGLAGLLGAVWPGGSVTGAPKLAAIDVATRLEPVGRGPSMGACGWIGHDRDGRLAIDLGLTIRTAAIAEGRVHLWAGGGIVWDSDPEAEVAEAAAKTAPIKAALRG
ncbi:chorismate-binding protein [Dactylosporangium sp. NPDC051485]|uniref:chorismate-binding protein n=1 Tax=Dactylosporangium sp. NPDC051485 TaxID=3154846 RepID=UPI003418F3EC